MNFALMESNGDLFARSLGRSRRVKGDGFTDIARNSPRYSHLEYFPSSPQFHFAGAGLRAF